jgi:hypothetical protein
MCASNAAQRFNAEGGHKNGHTFFGAKRGVMDEPLRGPQCGTARHKRIVYFLRSAFVMDFASRGFIRH